MNLIVFTFQTIIPLATVPEKGFTMEPFMYLGGGILTVVVGLLFMLIFIFVPIYSKLDKYKPNKVPAIVQNELDYIDYLTWTSKNGYEVYFSKKIMDIEDKA